MQFPVHVWKIVPHLSSEKSVLGELIHFRDWECGLWFCTHQFAFILGRVVAGVGASGVFAGVFQ